MSNVAPTEKGATLPNLALIRARLSLSLRLSKAGSLRVLFTIQEGED